MSETGHGPEKRESGVGPEQAAHPHRLKSDDVAGGVILIFCAVVLYLTTTFEEVPAMLSQGIPPTQFPRMMIGVIAVLTVLMMIQSHTRSENRPKRAPAMAFFTAALLVGFVAVVEWIGTLGAIFLFCLALPLLWGERRFGWILGYAIIFPVAIYMLFSKVLEVRFPAGIFETLMG